MRPRALTKNKPDANLPNPAYWPPPAYWLIPLLVAALRAAPFLMTRWVAPPTGKLLAPVGYNPMDFFAYASFIRQSAATGRWLLANPYATAPQAGRYILPLFSALGHLSRWTGVDPFWILELVRVPLIFLFFFVLWRFLQPLLPNPRQCLLAGWLIGLSGGIDAWLLATVGSWPPSLQRTALEALAHDQGWSTFASLNNPLWAAGLTLSLLALRPLLMPPGAQRPRDWIQFALAFLSAYFVHPYSGLVIVATAILLPAARWAIGAAERPRAYLIGLGASLIPPLLLIAAIARWQNQDPVFKLSAERVLGNYQLSVFWYPITFAAVGVLALRGWRQWILEAAPRRFEIGAWTAAVILMHNSPLFNGYHFVFQLHIPLCLAAAAGLDQLLQKFRTAPRPNKLLIVAGLALVFQAPLALTWRSIGRALSYQLPAPLMQAVAELRQMPTGNVFTTPHIGTLIPAFTPHKVYVGHWFLTPDYSAKEALSLAWLQGRESSAGLLALVHGEHINYLLLPPETSPELIRAIGAAARRVRSFDGYLLLSE